MGQVADAKELAKQVLSWITCAKRPLTTRELQHALGIEVGESELDNDNVPEIEDIISVCAGLVMVDKESNIIRLVHYTTQEYFERTQKYWFPDAETDITKSCVSYLLFNTFNRGFCSTNIDFEARLQRNALYDYAARNWGHHARVASAAAEHLILSLLESEAKLSACSQAMFASKWSLSHSGYSQQVPRNIAGVHIAACFGLNKALITLLTIGQDPNLRDTYSRTPLSWAAESGHEAVIRLLLENGAELESRDRNGRTPLSWAAESGHEAVIRLLLENGAELESRDGNGRTPLSWAAESGHEAVIRLLLENGAELESRDGNGQTPLSWAAESGHEAVIRLLLENGAELESRDGNGRTPLSWAAESGHEAVIRLLLENGAELESRDGNGQTPLSWAAESGHEAVIRLLLENGAELESRDGNGQTPLSWAAESGHEAVIRLLLENGAELESKDGNGHKAVV